MNTKRLQRLYRSLRLRLRSDQSEFELRIAPFFCDRKSTFLDIGADRGSYSMELSQFSASCVAFEPRLTFAAKIQELANSKGLKVQVQPVALSDHTGVARLRVLTEDPGRSTIESANVLDDPAGSPQVECLVPTLRLDDYGFKSVAFVKIDVEGHELAVLRGAEETLRQCSPTILVELEERHCPGTVKNASTFLATLGYDGFFILDGAVVPVSQFVQSSHQNPANVGSWKEYWVRRGVYIHNFFFLPSLQKQRLQEALHQLGAGSPN